MRFHGHTARRQRGSVMVIAAAALLVTLLATALAVDVGRLAWEQRRLQLVADLAALEAAKAIAPVPRCGGGTLLNTARNAARASATRNGFEGNLNNPTEFDVRLGTLTPDETTHLREFTASPSTPQAVEVTASKQVPRSLILPGELTGDQQLTAVAVARAQTNGAFQIGSFLARLNTEESPLLNAILGGLLGTSINLDAVSYQGLADTNVRLLDLINADATVGSVDELLNLDLSVGEFNALIADALSNDPSKASVAATLLGLPISLDLPDIHLGDVLSVEGAKESSAALNAQLNVLNLLGTALEVANRQHAVEAVVPINIPGVAGAVVHLAVIEPPQIAIGPAGRDADGEWITRAHNSQIHLQINLSLLGALNPAAEEGVVNLNVFVEVAEGRAGLECWTDGSEPSKPGVQVGAVPGIARIGVGKFDDITKLNPTIEPSNVVSLLGLLGVQASGELSVGSDTASPEYLTFDYPPPIESQTTDTGVGESLDTLLGDLADSLVVEFDDNTLLGPLLNLLLSPVLNLLGLGSANGILDLVEDILKPILNALDAALLKPLLDLLGLKLGEVDITVLNINMGRPELVR